MQQSRTHHAYSWSVFDVINGNPVSNSTIHTQLVGMSVLISVDVQYPKEISTCTNGWPSGSAGPCCDPSVKLCSSHNFGIRQRVWPGLSLNWSHCDMASSHGMAWGGGKKSGYVRAWSRTVVCSCRTQSTYHLPIYRNVFRGSPSVQKTSWARLAHSFHRSRMPVPSMCSP